MKKEKNTEKFSAWIPRKRWEGIDVDAEESGRHKLVTSTCHK